MIGCIEATHEQKHRCHQHQDAVVEREDGEGMAETITRIVTNLESGKNALYGVDEKNKVGEWRVNIPYSTYTGEEMK